MECHHTPRSRLKTWTPLYLGRPDQGAGIMHYPGIFPENTETGYTVVFSGKLILR